MRAYVRAYACEDQYKKNCIGLRYTQELIYKYITEIDRQIHRYKQTEADTKFILIWFKAKAEEKQWKLNS